MWRRVDPVKWTNASEQLLPAHAGSSFADISTLKMEAIRSSEASVYFTGSTRRHIPEDGILHSHRCENLKSYKYVFICRILVVSYDPRERGIWMLVSDYKHTYKLCIKYL
jgi:hypothetical protein